MEKKVFSRIKTMAVIISLIVTTLFCGCGKDKGEDNPNLGLYTAKYGSMSGVELEVGDVFGQGFTIELKEKNKCEVFVDGDKASGKWSLEGEKFTFSAGGIECEGTLQNGVIVLNDVMDTGIELTLINENYKGAASKKSDDESDDSEVTNVDKSGNGPSSINIGDKVESTDDIFLSADDKKWSGTWYGVISFDECTGAFEEQNECFYPVYMVVEFTAEDGGVFTVYDENEEFAQADFLIINDAITAVNGTAFDQPMNVNNYTFLSARTVENRIVMYDTIYGDAGTLDYTITLKPWGVRWEESEGLVYFDDVIAPYYKALDANEGPKFGWANPAYNGDAGNGEGSSPSLPGSMKKNSNDESDKMNEGPTDRRTEIQKYWNGDWYGWLNIYDATGNYKGFKDNSYDAFGRVEIDENGDGFLTLWYGYENGNTYDNPTGKIKINVSYEAGFGSHGTAISTGGWMFANDQNGWVEEMDFVIDPDEADYPDTLYFHNTYKDDGGSLTYIFALRPWGHRWEDVQANDKITLEASLHAFKEWYIPLIDEGWAMPDGYELKPTRTMAEYEQEMIEAAANQPITEGYSESSSSSGLNDSVRENSSSGSPYGTNISDAKVTGKSYTWGNIKVNIPDGMTATNGGIADRNDENSLWIQNGSSYILVSLCDKDKAQSDVAGTKSANNGEDTSVTINGTKWTGTYYEYSGNPCWHIYGEVNGNYFTAMGYNYSLDSVELQTVLATLSHS